MNESLIGCVFGRLTVIDEAPDRVSETGKRERMVLCRCECGNEVVKRITSLKIGNTKSCGCLRRELSAERRRIPETTKYPFYRKLRNVWRNMKRRCENPKAKGYKHYGEKGISVCNEWKDFNVFLCWSLENGYQEGLTIDRIDSNKDYCPENCRWANRKVQNNNTSRNHLLTYNGKTQSIALWADEMNLPYSTLKTRIDKHKWDVERALLTPRQSPGFNSVLTPNTTVSQQHRAAKGCQYTRDAALVSVHENGDNSELMGHHYTRHKRCRQRWRYVPFDRQQSAGREYIEPPCSDVRPEKSS